MDLQEFEDVFSEGELESRETCLLYLTIGIKHKRFFQFLYDNADIPQAVDRTCKFCLVIKPPRSHHCRICRRCVLKMDHHCKFVNNCIGYRNYKFFVVFLFYTTVTLMFILVNMIDGFKLYVKTYGWGTIECNFFISGYVYILTVFIAVIDLYIFHLGIICKGSTTIENKDNSSEAV